MTVTDIILTEKDFISWTTEMPKLFPDMTEEQKKLMLSTINNNLWDNVFGGKEKPEGNYKMSDRGYIH